MATILKPLKMLNRKVSTDDTATSTPTKLPALPKATTKTKGINKEASTANRILPPTPKVVLKKAPAKNVTASSSGERPIGTIDDHNLTALSFDHHSPQSASYTFDPNEKLAAEVSPYFTYSGESFKLEGEQPAIMRKVFEWLFTNPSRRKPFMRLAGYAGTGKTACIAYLINEGQNFFPSYMQKLPPVICTFTWKAALVLQSRGVPAVSIHSIFYKPVKVGDKTIFERRDPHEIRSSYSIIIIDEASMVDFKMRQDIEAIGLPVLYVGDSGQLPAISSYPEDATFMEEAELRLETIRRQALDSPIIRLSIDIRNGKRIPYGKYGPGVWKISEEEASNDLLLATDQVICGKNATRTRLNQLIRELKGFDPHSMPSKGEKLIGLSNLNDKGMYNGQFWYSEEDYTEFDIQSGSSQTLNLVDERGDSVKQRCVFPGDQFYKAAASKEQATHRARELGLYQVDFGDCITCHKAQGSAFVKPVVIEEWLGNKDYHKKWLYTCVTRAVKKLIIVSN